MIDHRLTESELDAALEAYSFAMTGAYDGGHAHRRALEAAIRAVRRLDEQPFAHETKQVFEATATPEETKAKIRAQFSELKGPAKVTCVCNRTIPVRFAYKCLYCDIFHCMTCAEFHFGKTRAQYYAEKAAPKNPFPMMEGIPPREASKILDSVLCAYSGKVSKVLRNSIIDKFVFRMTDFFTPAKNRGNDSKEKYVTPASMVQGTPGDLDHPIYNPEQYAKTGTWPGASWEPSA